MSSGSQTQPVGQLSSEQAPPSAPAFDRLVASQRFFRRMAGVLGAISLLLTVFSGTIGASLWIERETETNRALERFQEEPFMLAIDARISRVLSSDAFRDAVRGHVADELAQHSAIHSQETRELSARLELVRSDMAALQRELGEVLGELRAVRRQQGAR